MLYAQKYHKNYLLIDYTNSLEIIQPTKKDKN